MVEQNKSKKKIQRQGLIVSINQLRSVLNNLMDDKEEFEDKFNLEMSDDKKWQINIVNKKGMSDSWEIEGV